MGGCQSKHPGGFSETNDSRYLTPFALTCVNTNDIAISILLGKFGVAGRRVHERRAAPRFVADQGK